VLTIHNGMPRLIWMSEGFLRFVQVFSLWDGNSPSVHDTLAFMVSTLISDGIRISHVCRAVCVTLCYWDRGLADLLEP
jgi:hypothetical protein